MNSFFAPSLGNMSYLHSPFDVINIRVFYLQVCRFKDIRSNDNQDDLQPLSSFLEHVPNDLENSRNEVKT